MFDSDPVGLREFLFFPGGTHLFRTAPIGQGDIFSTEFF